MLTPQLKVDLNVAKRWDPELPNCQLHLSDLSFLESPTFQKYFEETKNHSKTGSTSQVRCLKQLTIQATPRVSESKCFASSLKRCESAQPKTLNAWDLGHQTRKWSFWQLAKMVICFGIKNWRFEPNYKHISYYISIVYKYLESRTNIRISYLSLLIISTEHRQWSFCLYLFVWQHWHLPLWSRWITTCEADRDIPTQQKAAASWALNSCKTCTSKLT